MNIDWDEILEEILLSKDVDWGEDNSNTTGGYDIVYVYKEE